MPRVVWSAFAGRRGYGDRPSSRVRVYERADSPGRIYLERAWVVGPERVMVLRHGTTRSAAESLAEKTAMRREELVLKGLDAYGETRETRLHDILKAYHNPSRNRKARKWSEAHQREQGRCRDFWLRELGNLPVTRTAMPPARIEAVAGDAASVREWSTRTEAKHLKYLMAATRWANRKARLITEDPLAGLELPDVSSDTRELVYTVKESRKLMTPHPGVDWRVTLAFALAATQGRRISAILHLWAGHPDVELAPDWAEIEVDGHARLFLHYRPEFDKGSRDQWVPVPEAVRPLVVEALDRTEVQTSGWLFPEGRLEYADSRDKPMAAGSIIKALHQAEAVLGIRRVPGRGFHGVKRLHVTQGLKVAGGDATRVGDITGNVSEHVLKHIYRQKDLPQMVAQVDAVAEILVGGGT